MIFTKEYNDTLKAKWNTYIGSDFPMPNSDSEIRSFIYESWKRSKAHGISPLTVKDFCLSDTELSQAQERNKTLIDVAHSYLQHLYSYVKGTNFVLALTDVEGYVLDLFDDDPIIYDRTRKTGLTVGCCRSEKYAGTNGIGTCLIEDKPLQIWACEHYIQPHHDYVCSAAPIHDPDGRTIGCLDVVGPVKLPHNHTLAMISAAADAIERELKMRRAYERLSIFNNQMTSTFQAIGYGIITYNNQGIITTFNRRACQILDLPTGDLRGRNISDIIDFDHSRPNIFEIKRRIENREASIVTRTGKKLSLSISLSTSKDSNDQPIGTVLVLNELHKIHSLVNRISGFAARYTFDSIIGESEAITATKTEGRDAADSDSTVLILGESGTGKELLAQAIHNGSSRSSAPFIAINCGSLPKGLIESELFGYERGAFTGANKEGQPGKFELAAGGTIFLDEIGDMPLELQSSLLRVLQTKEIVRIGGTRPIAVDVRVMAATNVDLPEAVRKREFREDLYYRINVLSIHIPPLRERKADIPLLADHFLRSISSSLNKQVELVSPEVKEALMNYNWPGNVRELENALERAVNVAHEGKITCQELPAHITGHRASHTTAATVPAAETAANVTPLTAASTVSDQAFLTPAAAIPTAAFPAAAGAEMPHPAASAAGDSADTSRSYQILIDALAAEHGNVSRTSERLGIPKRTLYRRIKKFNINIDEFRLL